MIDCKARIYSEMAHDAGGCANGVWVDPTDGTCQHCPQREPGHPQYVDLLVKWRTKLENPEAAIEATYIPARDWQKGRCCS